MQRKMRRIRQLMSEQDAERILTEGTNGVLSLIDPDGGAYGVPLSYVYDLDGHIYFHCALKGHKIDCIEADPRCSFCVVGQDLVMPDRFTSFFRSVIVKGIIHILKDSDDIMKGLLLLCEKYSPGVDPQEEFARFLNHVAVLRLDIDTMTGKEAIELVRKREEACR